MNSSVVRGDYCVRQLYFWRATSDIAHVEQDCRRVGCESKREGGLMGFLSEGVAVITGAGSGMGRGLAQKLAGMGASLAISDADEKGLAETGALLGSAKGKVTKHLVNVADEARVEAFPGEGEGPHRPGTGAFY